MGIDPSTAKPRRFRSLRTLSFRTRLRLLFIVLLGIALIPIPVSIALQSGAENEIQRSQASIRGLDRLTYLSTTITAMRTPGRTYAVKPSQYARNVIESSLRSVQESADAVPSNSGRDTAQINRAVANVERAARDLITEIDAGAPPGEALDAYEYVLQDEAGEVVSGVAVARARSGIDAQEQLLDALRSKLRVMQIVAAVSVLALMLGVWLLPILLSRRLEHLEWATQDIASGRYGNDLDIQGNDEIGRLARSFQAMSVALQLRDLENAHLLNAQIDRATRDSLTGLHNNRYFHETLDALLTTSRKPVTVAVFDLDNFKSVNDTFGHAEGDEVLRRVARAVASCIRRTDVSCRIGGEEFAIIFPDTDVHDTEPIMAKIASALRATDSDGRTTTFSCGLAMGTGGPSQDVFERADQAAYEAKRAGKNRIVIATDRTPAS